MTTMSGTMQAMRERMDKVGSVGLLSGEGMEFPVRVLDTKVVWGVQRFLVEPVGGKGQKWADAVRVRPMPAQGQAEAPGTPEASGVA